MSRLMLVRRRFTKCLFSCYCYCSSLVFLKKKDTRTTQTSPEGATYRPDTAADRSAGVAGGGGKAALAPQYSAVKHSGVLPYLFSRRSVCGCAGHANKYKTLKPSEARAFSARRQPHEWSRALSARRALWSGACTAQYITILQYHCQ